MVWKTRSSSEACFLVKMVRFRRPCANVSLPSSSERGLGAERSEQLDELVDKLLDRSTLCKKERKVREKGLLKRRALSTSNS